MSLVAWTLTGALAQGAFALQRERALEDVLDTSLATRWLWHVVAGAAVCALVVGAVETGYGAEPGGTVSAIATKALSVYVSAIGFAATFAALQSSMAAGGRYTYWERSRWGLVQAVRIEHKWLSAKLHLDFLRGDGGSDSIEINLSSTNTALQQDITAALTVRPGDLVEIVHLSGYYLLKTTPTMNEYPQSAEEARSDLAKLVKLSTSVADGRAGNTSEHLGGS